MNTRSALRNYIVAVSGITFLVCLFDILCSLPLDYVLYERLEYPLGYIKTTTWNRALYLSYATTCLLLWVLALSLVILLVQHGLWLIPGSFPRPVKKNKFALSITSSLLTLILFITLHYLIHATFPDLLSKNYITVSLINLIIANGAGFLVCKRSSRFIAFLKNRYPPKHILKILGSAGIIYIGLSICLSIAGIFWENRETTIEYKNLSSETTGDINVLLIVIDALRADHLGCYGYERATSPYLDAFAQEGVLFKNCYSQSSWTRPSVASLLTSLYPTMHGTIIHDDILPDQITTLPEIMQKNGFITYGYVANPVLKSIFNYSQGFDFFDDYLMREKIYYALLRESPFVLLGNILNKITGMSGECCDRDSIESANKRIFRWLEHYQDKNFFAYLHYMDPHAPYAPPKPYQNMYFCRAQDITSRESSLYDGEIRYVDTHIKKLFDKLKSWGIYDKTIIILTSDHGEAFGEHNNRRHGTTIYQEELKVPLIIKTQDIIAQGKVITQPMRIIDIMPTILNMVNIPTNGLEGENLLPLIRGTKEKGLQEDIFIEENYDNKFVLKGIVDTKAWKYIFTEKSEQRNTKKLGYEELYNLAHDPQEKNNLVSREVDILKEMRSRLDFFVKYSRSRALAPAKTSLDKETTDQLKALGYFQ